MSVQSMTGRTLRPLRMNRKKTELTMASKSSLLTLANLFAMSIRQMGVLHEPQSSESFDIPSCNVALPGIRSTIANTGE
jgi:hypothetical protein